ncbi:UNVERIFIED_CONTAM: hypothetical protein HDU68_012254 [Siphonaria sp. JEL0065]|nr:hypothetical protein HDU68_012254 [Siphonaria sp. JEL0065]
MSSVQPETTAQSFTKGDNVAQILNAMNAQLVNASPIAKEEDEESNSNEGNQVEVNAEMLQEMEKLMDAQREHLRVRESHMNIMREALADLTKKREELTSLRAQVSDAIKRNDITTVNNVHSRISELEESQTKFTEMLEVSQAIRESSLCKTINLDNEADNEDEDEQDDEDLKFENDLNNDIYKEDQDFDAPDKELTDYISANLSSLMSELNAIDPTTESTDAASEWVSGERDALISQLVELQKQSVAAHEKRNAQMAILQARQEELEEFQRQILALEKQVENNEEEEEGEVEEAE